MSVHADDLETSVRFYEDMFGMKRLPTPNFGMNIRWLALGDQQLHVFERDVPKPEYHHFGLDVEDFEGVYLKARERGILDGETFQGAVRELPDGSVQMYMRDPAGNLVEVNWPDVTTLDRSVVPEIVRVADLQPQEGEAAQARLYHAQA
ncbi:MAG TPA: VOC family protein [Gaiellaceae bacterium]|nr:VOC family protein [Gaiellaceae bacterium]